MKPPFEQLVRSHGATVLRVVRAILDPHDADDAWAETFLSALRAYPELSVDANTEAWLVRIAHRKALDLVRARARHAVPTQELPDLASTIGIPGRHDDELARALADLPRKQRNAVVYHHLGGLPYQEVAEMLGGTAAASRRAASDGIRTLRRTLGAAERTTR